MKKSNSAVMVSGPVPAATVYLIPSLLAAEATDSLPPATLEAIRGCSVFFVEQERSARRFLKQVWKEIRIDDYEWYQLDKNQPDSPEIVAAFRRTLELGKNIGIISEAGCPGVADPGQVLVAAAHEAGARVKPLVGPSSILLALMGSGMNGQQFRFLGYLPIEAGARQQAIREMEKDSARRYCTQLFIETPYRNNGLMQALLQNCQADTRIGIAADLSSASEFVRTRTARDWKKEIPDLHKRPVVFSLLAG